MKKLLLVLSSLVLFGIYSNNVLAAEVESLYTAQVPIKNMSERARESAIHNAFEQVLVKVSGDSTITRMPALKEDLSHADSYVDQFNYFDHRTENSDGMLSSSLNLRVQFDQMSINRLLKKAKQNIWGRQRPLTLVWLAVQTTDGRKILGSSSDNAIAKSITKDAALRGIPIIFPTLDLQDLNNISANEVWKFSKDQIIQASNRYSPDAIFVGQLQVNNKGEWQAKWIEFAKDSEQTWETTGKKLSDVIQPALTQLADQLAKQFLVQGTHGKDWLTITITGIHSFADFARLKNYLNQLSIVQNLETDNIEPNYVVLQLQVNGGQQQLQRLLNLDERLVPTTDTSDVANNAPPSLIYQWKG